MWPHPPQKCKFLSLSDELKKRKEGNLWQILRLQNTVSPFNKFSPKKKWLFMETQVDRRTRIYKMHAKVNSGANSHLKQKANMTTSMHESPSKSSWKQWPSVETIQQFMHYQHQPTQHWTPFLELELFHQLQCSHISKSCNIIAFHITQEILPYGSLRMICWHDEPT